MYIESQKTSSCQSNLEEKVQNSNYHAPWFQTILQTYSNQDHMDQWNRIESLEINPHIYGQLIYDEKLVFCALSQEPVTGSPPRRVLYLGLREVLRRVGPGCSVLSFTLSCRGSPKSDS